eukprot:2313717-Pleurochrysis_carterae.AAC.1
MRASVSSAAQLRTAVKVEPGDEPAGRAAPLSEDTVDEFNAEDGAPTRQLHEGRVRAAGDRGKGDEERKPRIGYHH